MVETNTNIVAPYVINAYVWELLKNNTSMTEADYCGDIPITSPGQDQNLTQFNKPFIVYGFAENPTQDVHVLRSGTLSYAVYSTNGGEITNILNIIRAAMERMDETAREVNNYAGTISAFHGITFGSISITYFESPDPEESEGGRKSGVISLRYVYTADYEVKTFQNGIWE